MEIDYYLSCGGKILHSYRGSDSETEIPEGVRKISAGAFCNRDFLKGVIIPKSVREIGSYAFKNCRNLKKVQFLGDIPSLDSTVFDDCRSLADENGFVILGDILYQYLGNEENVIIPHGVTAINEEAFAGNQNIMSIAIPNTVKTIGKKAFYACEKLRTIKLSYGVNYIGENAFAGCTALRAAAFPSELTIGSAAFCGCVALREMALPDCFIETEENAFLLCDHIRKSAVDVGMDRLVNMSDPFVGLRRVLTAREEKKGLTIAL